MKQFLLFISIALFISCNTKTGDRFVVDGSIRNAGAHFIYLEQNAPGLARPVIVDSSAIDSSGKFHLATDAGEESLYGLRIPGNIFPFALVINDSKKVSVNVDLGNTQPYSVSGSAASQGIIDFNHLLEQRSQQLVDAAREVDSSTRTKPTDSVSQRMIDSMTNVKFGAYQAVVDQLKDEVLTFMQNSKSPMLLLYALGNYQVRAKQLGLQGLTQTEVAGIINDAAKRFPDHRALRDQQKSLASQKAPDFSLPDTSGKLLPLSSFRGKYVLVDFWASWCQPCRMENPNVVAAFNQFRNKNFTILGVSLDKDREAWINAIHQDSLTWNHVSDLKFWNSEAAALYHVNSIPYNFLIDPNGNIIDENISGTRLFATLEKYLK